MNIEKMRGHLARVRLGLKMLEDDFVGNLLGRSLIARKARALVLHDQILTRHPRRSK